MADHSAIMLCAGQSRFCSRRAQDGTECVAEIPVVKVLGLILSSIPVKFLIIPGCVGCVQDGRATEAENEADWMKISHCLEI